MPPLARRVDVAYASPSLSLQLTNTLHVSACGDADPPRVRCRDDISRVDQATHDLSREGCRLCEVR